MTYKEIIQFLKSHENPEAVAGMSKFGITGKLIYGISIPMLRDLAKEIGKDHKLALRLWQYNNRETRILASMIDHPKMVFDKQMDLWVRDFDSWEVCDQCCMNLFEKLPIAYKKAVEWSEQEEEFVKRAGFVLMARLAVSDKKADDQKFEDFFPYIIKGSDDNRNFVKKAVNWALRQIGKRNLILNQKAIAVAQEILALNVKSGKWIAADALRELKSPAVYTRLLQKEKKK